MSATRRARPPRALIAALATCGLLSTGGPPAAAASELWVAIAISLRPPIEELAAGFEERTPGLRVHVHAAGSGVLVQQISRGAPADLFLSASPIEIDRLVASGHAVAGTRTDFASNELLVVVPRDRVRPSIVQDLVRPEYDVIVVANPRTAPLGRYTLESLDSLRLRGELESRLVQAENAGQVLDYVRRGEVAAGIVYRSDATRHPDRVRAGPAFPAESHSRIVYQGVVLGGARQPDAALALLETIAGDEGRRVLARHGFGPPR